MPDTPLTAGPPFQSFTPPPQDAGARAAERIARTQALLAANDLDAVLVPRADRHQGEYVAACDERLAWLTGFTGSAGLAVIIQAASTIAAGADAPDPTGALFVDGRYTLQGGAQTAGTGLAIVQVPATAPGDWLAERLPTGARVGFDPALHTVREITALAQGLDAQLETTPALAAASADTENPGLTPPPSGAESADRETRDDGDQPTAARTLVPLTANPIDALWEDRPAPPDATICHHPAEYAGTPADEKIAAIQDTLTAEGHDALLLAAPDSICWLLNLRGQDIPRIPVPRAFCLVPAKGKVTLYIGDRKSPDDILSPDAVASLDTVATALPVSDLCPSLRLLAGKTVLMSSTTVPIACQQWLEAASAKVVLTRVDPVQAAQAIKNDVEQQGARDAHLRDAVAMCQFLAWLSRTAPECALTEIDLIRQLEATRVDNARAHGQPLRDISFDAICGAGPNGAIVHYRVTEASNRAIDAGNLVLIDSGGQYLDGTTDVTRTIAIGTPTPAMSTAYTLVLRGHLAIAAARFPDGTRGVDLDPLARNALWQAGLDYGHGTGHGVGSYLSVHEGPAGISRRAMEPIKAGMILSNEPGFYWQDNWGIRIENLELVRPATDQGSDSPDGLPTERRLSFETLTHIPYDSALIDLELLTDAERNAINDYHSRVAEKVSPHLNEADRAWLLSACAPLL
ncbi:MAG: aminopeptidase P family protein [Pseudomonadota bacterium]